MALIIGLAVAAIVLALGELLLPGGVLGVLAVGCLCGVAYFTFEQYGLIAAVFTFLGASTATVASLFLGFYFLQKSGLGRGIFLNSRVEGHTQGANPEQETDDALIGKEGETLTPLVPTGMIQVDGRSYEAFSQSGFLEKGETCKVIGKDNFRLIVRSST